MLSKHKVSTSMSGLLAVKRGFVAAVLLIGLASIAIGLAAIAIGLAASADAQAGSSSSVSTVSSVPPNAHSAVPEIAVGAGISAFVLAGGGLLLLADRLRGKKKSRS
jgi:hypothetical protein